MDLYEHYQHAPGFTPVRRPESQIVADSPFNPSVAAWTTSRCNRLLRPISSRIARLRKDRVDAAGNSRPGFNAEATANRPIVQITPERPVVHTSAAANQDDDPEWAPNPRPSKRPCRTYGGGRTSRRPLNRSAVSKTTQLSGSSKLLASLVANEQNQDAAPIDREIKCYRTTGTPAVAAENAFKRTLRTVAKTSKPPMPNAHYDGLGEALRNLLVSTASSHHDSDHIASLQTKARSRVPSLFKMCLRAVPKYIAIEQAYALEEDPDTSVDMSDIIYRELESFGSTNGKGWKPLRTIARTHGIYMLADAVIEGLLSPSFIMDCIRVCSLRAPEEGKILDDALVSSVGNLNSPTSTTQSLFVSSTSDAMWAIHLSTTYCGESFLYSSLGQLFLDGALPPSWIAAPDMTNTWYNLIRSVGRGEADSRAAMQLVRIAVGRSCWNLTAEPAEVLHHARTTGLGLNTVHGIEPSTDRSVARLVSHQIAQLLIFLLLVPEGCADPQSLRSAGLKMSELIQDVVSIPKASLLAQTSLSADEILRIRYVAFIWLMFPYYWSSSQSACDWTQHDEEVLGLWTFAMENGASLLDVSSIAVLLTHTYANIKKEKEFPHVRKVVEYLLEKSTTGIWQRLEQPENNEICLSNLAVTIALEYASVSDQKQLGWAYELQELYGSPASTSAFKDQPHRPMAASGMQCTGEKGRSGTNFRYEESIGEWITKTPAASAMKRRDVEQPLKRHRTMPPQFDSSSEDGGSDNPAEPTGSISDYTIKPSNTLLDLIATPAGKREIPRNPGCAVVIELRSALNRNRWPRFREPPSDDELASSDSEINNQRQEPHSYSLSEASSDLTSLSAVRHEAQPGSYTQKRHSSAQPTIKRKAALAQEGLAPRATSLPRLGKRKLSRRASLAGGTRSREASFIQDDDSSDELGQSG